ncbi:tetratricopeptide (TPR) repeat protein [Streptomyces sp. Ag109_O5-1]|uniref:tetratricopeptide repeat protein n=1 Tax=Streptomyces sp. Ag109_O5-1 TaxID=1938851 RepID=UPI000F510E22|nr:tetratricopeptide repeat protein [Streptomyces sp. Ag109_O5-1]RPE40605.1 tetratricopeptide (TPR) repeat protein [Streptomyces sp. Ag109_O5-1]
MRAALSALLAALAEGAGGDAGRVLAEAANDSRRPEALQAWGDRVAELLGGDPRVAGAVAAAMERYVPGSAATWYGGDHSDFRGGVFLREVVGVQVVIQQSGGPAAPEALASLPPRPGGFTGRKDETSELLRALDDSAAVLVTALSGLGGIGKTALAVETAHLACGKGWFPGGVLFVDLHGYDEQPVSADQALQSLLRALGVLPQHIPATADDRAVLYRSVLAERARERGAVLVLADNASSPDQVRPLLPGEGRHRVLVTSRDRLPQLGARLVPLDQLTPEEARRLLDLALRIADPEDRRVADDTEAAGQLADLCGHLPLALQIAVALLAEDPGMPVAELVGELEASHDRLVHLDDGERSVRAAFELSYRRLSPEQARLLRLLALAPGPEVSDEVAAVLMGTDAPPLRNLRALARAHLVERGSGRAWWRLHDLVRVYGVGVAAGDVGLREEGEAARDRVLGLYLRRTNAADIRLRWLPGMPMPEWFVLREEALAWLDAERVGLVAAVGWAREARFSGNAVRLALSLAEYLHWRRYFDDMIATARLARDACNQTGDHVREGIAWNNLGSAMREVGRADEAIEAHARARELFKAGEYREGEANAWNNLGSALREAGRVEEAIETLSRSRDLHAAAGNRHREAMAWNSLGWALYEAGRTEGAIEALIRARDLHAAAGDRHRVAIAVNNLGNALQVLGRTDEAIEAFTKSIEIRREFEDWYGEGVALYNLAFTQKSAHRLAAARTAFLQAAEAYARANAPVEAAEVRAYAAELDTSVPTAPAPTGKPTPASPPARTTDSAQPAPPQPNAPDSAGP